MLKSAGRRMTARLRYYLVSADAFLLTGALFLFTMGILALMFHQPSLWSELLSQVAMVGSLVGGTVIAWTWHGNILRGASWLFMALGIVVGALVGVGAFFALFMLGRFIPTPFQRDEGPWGSILLLAAAVIAFLAVPVYEGVRDLVRRTGSAAIAVTRLAALIIIVTVIIISMALRGDVAEVGIFMVPVSAASPAAIALVAWFPRWRARRRLAQPRRA